MENESAVALLDEAVVPLDSTNAHPAALTHLLPDLFAHCIWQATPTPTSRRCRNPYYDNLPFARQVAIELDWRIRGLLAMRPVCRRWDVCVTQALREEHHAQQTAPDLESQATLTGQRVLKTLSKISLLKPRWRVMYDEMTPLCSCGHCMEVSDYSADEYDEGWECDACGREMVGQLKRWFCRDCSRDHCFSCRPAPVFLSAAG